jgi:hypothetical protein
MPRHALRVEVTHSEQLTPIYASALLQCCPTRKAVTAMLHLFHRPPIFARSSDISGRQVIIERHLYVATSH